MTPTERLEDYATSDTGTTTDHVEIRRRVDEHGGKPASVRGTERGDAAGVLRIDFPAPRARTSSSTSRGTSDSRGSTARGSSSYTRSKASGEGSTFFKLVSR